MLGVAHFEGEAAEGYAVPGGLDAGAEDVDVLVGEDPGDVAQEPGAVEGFYLDRYQEDAGVAWGPVDGDHALALGVGEVFQVDAVGAVDGDAVAVGDEALDLVAGDRGAALGQADPDVGDALDLDARVAGGAGPRDLGRLGRDGGDLGEVLTRGRAAADRADQLGRSTAR